MKKLWLVYNPRSSKHEAVDAEVLAAVRNLKGWMVGKYEVKATDVDDNVRTLAKLINDDDLVVAAGGDGTATIAMNAVMKSKTMAKLGVLGYGNFNDMAKTFGIRRAGGITEIIAAVEAGRMKDAYLLEVKVDNKHWRYAMCYTTIGLFAESTEVFDEAKTRKKLQNGKRTPMFSWRVLAKWYFRNRKKRVFIPKFKLNGVSMPAKTTDYVAMNGPRMAGVMKGQRWYLKPDEFGSATAGLTSFWRLFVLMAKSVLWRVPAKATAGDILELEKPGTVEIQAEGEYQKFKDARKIEVRKAKKCIKVVVG